MFGMALTALITGASGGIGEQLARVFASHGHNVVLVARSQDKLEALAAELSTKHGVKTYPVKADLANPTAGALLVEQLDQQLPIDILVNNAGFGDYGEFAAGPLDKQLEMIQLNIATLTELTHRFLPQMLSRKQGYILQVASTAAFMPGPLMSVYYASKAYVLSFSEALREELKGSGVHISALCPGPVATGFQGRADMGQSKLFSNPLNPLMESSTVANAGYAGLMQGQGVIIPGFMNKFLAILPRFMPRAIVPAIVKNAQDRH
jgi:uncharacterized protein